MELGLQGRRALVTGASRGLGRACAEALIAEGARVFICARQADGIRRVAEEIGAAGASAADVSRAADVDRVVGEATSALGGLDILVTNAGGPPPGVFDVAGDEDWATGYELTLMSAVRLIRAALPALRASTQGRVVNLTGYGVKEPISDLVVSDSMRAAVTVMAKTIATDLAPAGITVNDIATGPVLTERMHEIHGARAAAAGISLDEQLQRAAAEIPAGRIGRPEEVGALCAYLCSRLAAFVTGQAIVIDGGANRAI
jgi:3-oxoacyl-[acyl-carrier protein] reductase